jgi:predicted DCC family thiol-disulfide oxidoreductase YuxK
MDPNTSRPHATVYYDGVCPLCSREIAHYRKAAGAERLDFVDAATCEPGELGAGLTRDAALARMHVRLADGSLVSGAAAFGMLWRRLPRFAWAGRLAGLPVVLPCWRPAIGCSSGCGGFGVPEGPMHSGRQMRRCSLYDDLAANAPAGLTEALA